MSARFLMAPLAGLAIAGTAAAQQAAPKPEPVVPTIVVPPAASALPPPIVALPSPTPSPTAAVVPRVVVPRVVVPRTVPTPVAVQRPRVAASASAPVMRPTPSTPAPIAAAPVPVVTPTAAPVVAPVVAATVAPSPTPVPVAPADGGWMLPAGIAAAAAAGAGALIWFRRRRTPEATEALRGDAASVVEEPAVAPVPVVAAPAMLERRPVAPAPAPAAAERAWLAFELRPRRAGVNLLTATLDVELVVRNDGDAVAENIRIDIRLLSARAAQEAELAAVFGEPIARPLVAPFALAPGATRSVTTLATLARGSINVLQAGERPMFVPVVAVNLRYATAGTAAQTAEAFAIGVERAGAAKLAPVWLDVPAKMHEAIGARPHTLALRS